MHVFEHLSVLRLYENNPVYIFYSLTIQHFEKIYNQYVVHKPNSCLIIKEKEMLLKEKETRLSVERKGCKVQHILILQIHNAT